MKIILFIFYIILIVSCAPVPISEIQTAKLIPKSSKQYTPYFSLGFDSTKLISREIGFQIAKGESDLVNSRLKIHYSDFTNFSSIYIGGGKKYQLFIDEGAENSIFTSLYLPFSLIYFIDKDFHTLIQYPPPRFTFEPTILLTIGNNIFDITSSLKVILLSSSASWREPRTANYKDSDVLHVFNLGLSLNVWDESYLHIESGWLAERKFLHFNKLKHYSVGFIYKQF